jgi:hypothetical protein
LSHASSPKRETGTYNQEMSSVASAKLSAQLFDLLVDQVAKVSHYNNGVTEMGMFQRKANRWTSGCCGRLNFGSCPWETSGD